MGLGKGYCRIQAFRGKWAGPLCRSYHLLYLPNNGLFEPRITILKSWRHGLIVSSSQAGERHYLKRKKIKPWGGGVQRREEVGGGAERERERERKNKTSQPKCMLGSQ